MATPLPAPGSSGAMSYKKKIPVFKTEEEERAFWAAEETMDYIDWSKANKVVFPNLKLSTKTISFSFKLLIL